MASSSTNLTRPLTMVRGSASPTYVNLLHVEAAGGGQEKQARGQHAQLWYRSTCGARAGSCCSPPGAQPDLSASGCFSHERILPTRMSQVARRAPPQASGSRYQVAPSQSGMDGRDSRAREHARRARSGRLQERTPGGAAQAAPPGKLTHLLASLQTGARAARHGRTPKQSSPRYCTGGTRLQATNGCHKNLVSPMRARHEPPDTCPGRRAAPTQD